MQLVDSDTVQYHRHDKAHRGRCYRQLYFGKCRQHVDNQRADAADAQKQALFQIQTASVLQCKLKKYNHSHNQAKITVDPGHHHIWPKHDLAPNRGKHSVLQMMERIRAYNQCCHTGHHEQQPHPSGHPLQIPHKGQGDTQVNRRRQHSSWLGQAIQDKRQLPVRPLHKLHDNHRDHPECITDHKCQIQFVEKMQLGGPDAPDHKSRNGDQRPDKNDYCYVVHWLLLF